MVLLGDEAQVKALSVELEIVLILMQDRCTVCAERTKGSEIILDVANGTPRLRGSCGMSFWSIWRQCSYWSHIGARFAPSVP